MEALYEADSRRREECDGSDWRCERLLDCKTQHSRRGRENLKSHPVKLIQGDVFMSPAKEYGCIYTSSNTTTRNEFL
jgi:hypothetical protein